MDKKFVFKSPVFLIPFLLIVLVILGTLIVAFNNANSGSVNWLNDFFASNESVTPTSSDSSSGSKGGTDGSVVDLPGVPTDGGATNTKDQKLIKTGSVSITVDDFDKSSQKVRDIAASVNGLVTSSSDTGKDNTRSVVISIKVPAKNFDSVVKQLKAIGVTVVTSSETSYDITQTYIDLKARLKNQKALEAQLILILDKATKVSDILLIQQELSNVQGQIEVLQSQINYYDSQIDMSTITVSMSLNKESLSVVDNTWKPLGTFRTALQSLITVFLGLLDLIIWIVVFSPIVLIPLIIYWFVKKARKKAKK
ncbi:MAG TPA: DUF4349 domain-containing protein [Candidatus Dojkabacteria bacterium]|nr:DUF4349 domain-containing protein [Candidatus Dojkabacteria bacterium]